MKNEIMGSGSGNNKDIAKTVINPHEISNGEIWELLQQQVLKYTGADSCSVPEEVAQQLLNSVLYSLKFGALHGVDTQLPAKQQLLLSQQKLVLETERVKGLYSLARCETPYAGNVYFSQTMQELGIWINLYDIRFFAQLPPSGIDYQLMVPVRETLQGVEYAAAYLCGVLAEIKLAACFAPSLLVDLFDKWMPEWPDLCVNLCEPILTCGLGCTVLDRSPNLLSIDDEGRNRLWELLRTSPAEQAEKRMETAVAQLLNQLQIWPENIRGYFKAQIPDLLVRIRNTGESGWRKLFIQLGPV